MAGGASKPHCRQCNGHDYDRARSLGIYSHALKAAVVGLKTRPHVSARVAELLRKEIARFMLAGATLIIPVPLSKQRMLERGFNQAEFIAREIGHLDRTHVDSHSLTRTKHSRIHRAGMDQKARELSVKNCFSVTRPKLIQDQTILLVDDVFTTGATVSHCAKELKKYGARAVNVLTLARAVDQGVS